MATLFSLLALAILSMSASAGENKTKSFAPTKNIELQNENITADDSIALGEEAIKMLAEKGRLERDAKFLDSYNAFDNAVQGLVARTKEMTVKAEHIDDVLSDDLRQQLRSLQQHELITNSLNIRTNVWNERDFGRFKDGLEQAQQIIANIEKELKLRGEFHEFFVSEFVEIRERLEIATRGDIDSRVSKRIAQLELAALESADMMQTINGDSKWTWSKINKLARPALANLNSRKPKLQSLADLLALKYLALTRIIVPAVEASARLAKEYSESPTGQKVSAKTLWAAMQALGITSGVVAAQEFQKGNLSFAFAFGAISAATVGAGYSGFLFEVLLGAPSPITTLKNKYSERQQEKLEHEYTKLLEKSCQVLLVKKAEENALDSDLP